MTHFGWTIDQDKRGRFWCLREDKIRGPFRTAGEAGKWAFRNAKEG